MSVPTPYLVLDLARLQANIERTAAFAAARGVALRPHVKTHKIPQIGRLQVAAGATGITVATIGEAEVFVGAGFTDVFVGYPLWLDAGKRARLAALARRAIVRVGCDTAASLDALAGLGVPVLVEVDSGHHRSGVHPELAGELALAAQAKGVPVDGVFTFPGHSYSPEGRRRAAEEETAALSAAAGSLRACGIEPVIVSGGSTPSLGFAGDVATEYRPGVYVVNDAQQWELGSCTPDRIALTCRATVVSHAGGRAVLDCGSKILGADRAAWATGYGRLLDDPDARIVQLSEHHAVVEMTSLPAPGSLVRVVPNHACNAINLVDEVFLDTGEGAPTESWRVAARGRNS